MDTVTVVVNGVTYTGTLAPIGPTPPNPQPPNPNPPQPGGINLDPTQPDKAYHVVTVVAFNSYPLPPGKTYWEIGVNPDAEFPTCVVELEVPGGVLPGHKADPSKTENTSGYFSFTAGGPFGSASLPPNWQLICRGYYTDGQGRLQSVPLQVQCVPR